MVRSGMVHFCLDSVSLRNHPEQEHGGGASDAHSPPPRPVDAMSLLRAATARHRQILLSTIPRRNASTHHDEHHHDEHHHEDTTVYPQESA